MPEQADALCETIFCAERIDLAWQAHEEIDLGVLWSQGCLTASRTDVQGIVSAMLDEQEEESPGGTRT